MRTESAESLAARYKALAYLRAGSIATLAQTLCKSIPAANEAVARVLYFGKSAAVVIWKPLQAGKRKILLIVNFHCDGTYTLHRDEGACRRTLSGNVFEHCSEQTEEAIRALGVP